MHGRHDISLEYLLYLLILVAEYLFFSKLLTGQSLMLEGSERSRAAAPKVGQHKPGTPRNSVSLIRERCFHIFRSFVRE